MTDSLDTLTDDELEFLLQASESGDTIDALELEEPRHGATMRGDIEQIGLTDILQTLALSKMEGVLRVCNPLESRHLYIADGYIRPIMPTATRRRRLLGRLVQAGLVEVEALRRAVCERRPTPVALEDLLTEAALVRAQDLEDAANAIFDEELFSLFTWRRGTFELFRSEEAAAALGDAFGAAAEYEVHSLLLEVARRSDDWARILDAIGSLEEIPTRSSASPPSASCTPEQRAIWSSADGQSTYRQLAEETTLDLFDFARAAASLYSAGEIKNVAESDLLEIAAAFAEGGDDRRAAVTLQSLLERSEDPAPRVTLRVAEIYGRIGMRRKAVRALLEAAQRTSASEDARRLAHAAYEIDPTDVATLHFLRSVLVAIGDDAPAEDVRVITIALVDALILDGRAERALEILTEAKDGSTDDDDQELLLREARAHQRLGHSEGAVARYVSLARAHIAAGERQLAAAAYEQALRIEPRREIARALSALRRTRIGAMIRVTAMGLVTTMIAAMGWVWLEQHQRQDAMCAAMNELEAVLATGDHAAARRALATWDAQLGGEEAFQDLESRVAFAESAQSQREAAAARAATAAKMQSAAETLAQGRVHEAIVAYGHALDGAQDQAMLSEIASRRLRSLAERVQQATSRVAAQLPPDPHDVLAPESLTQRLASLQSQAPPAVLNAHEQFTQIQERGAWPAYLDVENRRQIEAALTTSAAHVARIRELMQGYHDAIRRAERQRELEPMFRAAKQCEERLEFARALTLYTALAREATDPVMSEHFAARAARNRDIDRLLQENREAAALGDYNAAFAALTRLRRSHPATAWETCTSLPLRILSTPAGASVTVDGRAAGSTPVTVHRAPAEEIVVSVTREGYQPLQARFKGAARATWDATLALRPTADLASHAPVEASPVHLPSEDVLIADRRGVITRWTRDFTQVVWRTETRDLSGLLTRPLLYEDLALVGSIDGDLRAVDVDNGTVRWSESALPCETAPAIIGETLVMATTNASLCFLQLRDRRRSSVPLEAAIRHDVVALGPIACTVVGNDRVVGWAADGSIRWRFRCPATVASLLSTPGGDLLVIQEDGRATLLEPEHGRSQWTTALLDAPIGAASCFGDVALIATPDALLRVLLADGASMPPIAAPEGAWSGQVAARAGELIALNTRGDAYVYGVADGALRSRMYAGVRGRLFATADTIYIATRTRLLQYHGQQR